MGDVTVPPKAHLIMGVLWTERDVLQRVQSRLENLFGQVEGRSQSVPFESFTKYYSPEMGDDIKRCFLSFEDPYPQGGLQEVKITTNRLEGVFSKGSRRKINLDPGLLTLGSLVLATTKPHYHRIYLGKGIYAEMTLIYREKEFQPLPWTYPDYREEWTRNFFLESRTRLKRSHEGQ